MKRIILSSLLFLYSFASVYSQSNFKEGFIITTSNDTVRGLIDFRTDLVNSTLCKFKQGGNELEINFKPGEIIAYRLVNEGKYYVSKKVMIDKVEQEVFLEFLLKGILNLYYFPQDNGFYFFENQDGTMTDITKKSDEIIENRMKKDIRYKGIMTYVFRDCLPLALKASEVAFDRKSMIKFTKNYHDRVCDFGEACIIFENDYKKKFTRFDLTGYSGFEMNTLRMDYFELYKMTSFSPIIGTEIEVSSPRLIKSLSLKLDINFSQLSGAYDYSNSANNSYFIYNWSGLKTSVREYFKYTYPNGVLRPSIELAYSYAILLNLKSTYNEEFLSYENSVILTKKQNEILPLNAYSGLRAGIGVDFHLNENQCIICKLMYNPNESQIDKLSTLQVKLGYRFKL